MKLPALRAAAANGWTGGQYSLFRGIFGLYLCVHLAALLPWGAELFSNQGMLADAAASPLYPLFPNPLFWLDAPWAVSGLLGVGVVASGAFALGFRDRAAALVLWFVWAALFTRNPLISNPGLPFVGWLLLAHACLPARPYGSWGARGRTDPGSGWRLPEPIWISAWIVMATGYSYSGVTKLVSPSWLDGSALLRVLENPLARPGPLRDLLLELPEPLLGAATWGALSLELLFAPLALFARARPWLWFAMAGMHLSLIGLIDFADLSLGMLMLQLFTFDPGWLARRGGAATVYYDGGCGLCHGLVRLLLSEDRPEHRAGTAFRFAPLEGAQFRGVAGEDRPDSVILQTADGARFVRTGAVIEIARRLGGLWRVGGEVLARLPRRPLDALYDRVAAVRHRLFRRPEAACPLLPPELRARFDL